ncbi:hypothetical protein BJV78DRAFT_459074 [Lactifluus subvellereus]|nr:hypothetical protein BJV78DRAFT_459074 [Lactifluus subvellereus]
MSDEPHLPGYNVDDDDAHNELVSSSHAPAAASERADDLVLTTSTGDTDAAVALQVSTEPTSTTTQQQPEDLAAPPPALPQRPPVDEFADPKIASLHAIFPDFDAAILYTVVDSVRGDQDRAVDALLAMSDPNHVPSSGGGPQDEPTVSEQTQLDEEFARQLMLEDEQRYARDQIAWRQQQQQQQTRQFPYAQRTGAQVAPHPGAAGGVGGAAAAAGATQQQGPQRDTMTDVQEQFTKLAESGKRTFSSFVSKVKAKVQEFDQSRNGQAQNPSYTYTGSGTATAPPPSSSSDGGLDRHAQQVYYAPSTNPDPPRGHAGAVIDERNALDPPSSLPASTATASVTVVDDDDSATAVSPPSATRSGPPPSNIDPGKIGLLPKRPVSLVNTQSQPSRAPDEEEELEYVENPFEEGRYS